MPKIKELSYNDWWTDAEIVYMTNCINLLQNCVIKEFSFEGFDVTKLQNASYMFSGCSSLTTLNLSSFDMTKVTNYNNNVSGMFNGCSKLTTIYANTTFDYSSKNIDMFSGCSMLVGGSGTAYADMPTTNNLVCIYCT